MKNNKFKTLAVLAALLATTIGANAVENASQTLNATLAAHTEVAADGGTISATIDPLTGDLSNAFTPAFKVQTNVPVTVYFQGETTTAGGAQNAFFEQGGTQFVALSNTASGEVPADAALADCINATPVAVDNANIIAYGISGIALSGASSSVTPSYDSTLNQYEMDLLKGDSVATATTLTAARTDTYSYDDAPGTYQAVVTMTTSSL